MKIVKYDIPNKFYEKHGRILYKELEENGYEILDYDKDKHLWKMKHFQLYQGFLDYAEKINVDFAFINGLLIRPEIFLSELKVRNIDFKIIVLVLYKKSYTDALKNVLRELNNLSCVESIYIGTGHCYPSFWKGLTGYFMGIFDE